MEPVVPFTASQKIADLEKHWDHFDPEQIAEKIIELEEMVGKDPSLRKKVDHLHFKFIFPISLEMETTHASFARNVQKVARDILKQDSTAAFKDLNTLQQKEVIRYARST